MKNKNLLIGLAVSGLVAGISGNAMASGTGQNPCKGVAPKGANSCGANGHKCGGFAKDSFNAKEWIYLSDADCKATTKALKTTPALKKYIEAVAKNARNYKANFSKK